MNTRIMLVRHAEAEGNIKRLFHGWTDSGITENGHRQAARLARRFKRLRIDCIYSSSLVRAVQTAEYIADVKDLPVITTDTLKEINGGGWEDVSWADLAARWPEEYSLWENSPHLHKMPNGESMQELFDRIVTGIMKIISENKGRRICIVTHGTAIKTLMCHMKGCSLGAMADIPWYENTSVTIADYCDRKRRFKIIAEGDYSHLDESTATLQNQKWWKDIQDVKGEA